MPSQHKQCRESPGQAAASVGRLRQPRHQQHQQHTHRCAGQVRDVADLHAADGQASAGCHPELAEHLLNHKLPQNDEFQQLA